MTRKLLVISGVFLLACVLVPVTLAEGPTLRGDMTLTVKTPVSVPGGVLAPGKYHMRFIDPDFTIVSITREDGTAVGMYHVRPAILPEVPGDAEIMIGWLPDGSPAIREFGYPGETTAFQFEYPGEQPVLVANNPAPANATVAQASDTGSATTANETADMSSQSASATTGTAESNPSELMSGAQETNPMMASAGDQSSPELPQTASPLPLLGLLGIGSVVAGMLSRRRLRNVEKL